MTNTRDEFWPKLKVHFFLTEILFHKFHFPLKKKPAFLLELLQDVESLPPPRRPAEGFDKKTGGSCVQRGETSPHDVIDVKHLSVMAAAHAQRQISQ